MQKGSTFAVAWAVLASVALPHAARADSSALSPVTPIPTVETNQLGLVDGRFYVFDLSKLPIPGQQKVGVDLLSIGKNMGDIYLKAESNNLFNFKGVNFSAHAAGTWETMTGGDLSGLNVGLLATTKVGGGDASLNLSSTVGGLDDGRFNAAFSWTKPLEGGSSVGFTANGQYDAHAEAPVAGQAWLRLNINLHPDAPVAPSQPLDLGQMGQWEGTGAQPINSSSWGLEGWESR